MCIKKNKCCCYKNNEILLESNNHLLLENKELKKRIEELEKDKEEHKGVLLDLIDKIRLFLTRNYNEIYKLSVNQKPEELENQEQSE